MNNLQVFKNREFGQVRTIEVNGEPHFIASDVAKSLGYKDPTNAIKLHCRWVVKCHIPHPQSKSKTLEVNCIPISDLFRLGANSELPGAKQFESWIFDEVLPTLHKTGKYEMPKTEKPRKPQLPSVNMAAKIMRETLKDAGCDKKYIAVAVGNLYKSEAGIDFGVPLISDAPELWDCTSMAKHIGICSKKGNPHDKAVSAIIQKLSVPDEYIVKVPYERNGHPGVTVQYTKEVLQMVKRWLENNGYPRIIEYRLSNGNTNQCKVSYQEVA